MQENIVPVFTCDFCGKKQFRKSDMSLHEKWCKKNPKNMHKCFQFCVHLVKEREDIEDESEYYSDFPRTRATFTCAVLNKKMYSYKAERRNLVKYLTDAERMPLECNKYKDRMEENPFEGNLNDFGF